MVVLDRENNLNETDSAAEKNCRKALADAGFAFGWPASFHWSQLINPRGDKAAAIIAYKNLLEAEENNKSALEGLAYLYQVLGYQDQAQIYRKKLRAVEVNEMGVNEEQKDDVIDYLLAKIGEANSPERAPTEFVRAHFDKYADKFDELLVDNLEYIGPELIKQQIENWCPVNSQKLSMLDLGCGTGLVGNAVSCYSKSLVGVDLSGEMLEKAGKRECYDKLVKDDCSQFLVSSKESYDVITAADVLGYYGNLSSIFALIQGRLSEGGLFIFTIESTKLSDFALRNTGRYQHSEDYIQQLAAQQNFKILCSDNVDLRKEQGKAIDAMLISLQA